MSFSFDDGIPIRVGPAWWKLTFTPERIGGFWAETIPEHAEIRVYAETPQTRLLEILIHEIFHAITCQYSASLELSHEQIDILSNALAQILDDNWETLLALFPDLGERQKIPGYAEAIREYKEGK